jgi:transcriptional regulator with XRE-family HTH domain
LKGGANIRLAETRKAQGFSQARLSEMSGVARITIARIETGKQVPTIDTVKKLADALNVSIDELVCGKGA